MRVHNVYLATGMGWMEGDPGYGVLDRGTIAPIRFGVSCPMEGLLCCLCCDVVACPRVPFDPIVVVDTLG